MALLAIPAYFLQKKNHTFHSEDAVKKVVCFLAFTRKR